MRDFFCKVLRHLGHEIVVIAENGEELVAGCRNHPPDLIVTDIAMPEMDGLEAVREISRERPVPVILVSTHHEGEYLKRAQREQVLADLIKLIKRADLEPAIALAMQRFREFQALHGQAADLEQALEM